MVQTSIQRRALLWLAGDDTGSSSMTLARHMLALPHDSFGPNAPSDGGDLGRCLRLLRAIPEWQHRIGELAAVNHSLAALVPHWDELAALLTSEIGDDLPPRGHAPKTYARMSALLESAHKADGWITLASGARVKFS